MGITLNWQVVANSGGNNPTTSGLNSFGTNNTGNYNTIVAGTGITFGLTASVNAFGLTVITPDDMFDDDIQLVAGGETALLLDSARQAIAGAPGYYAYFLGVISTTGFSSARIAYASGVEGAFLYNIDDLTVAVTSTGIPEPGTLALLLGGVPVWLLRRGRWA